MPISFNAVIFQFHWLLWATDRRIMSRMAFLCVVVKNPIDRCKQKKRAPIGFSRNITMKGDSWHKERLATCQIRVKFENDHLSRNWHKIRITQPNLMIEVSFFSAKDALSNGMKVYIIFSSQCTENPPFRFFWDTRYLLSLYYLILWNHVDILEKTLKANG